MKPYVGIQSNQPWIWRYRFSFTAAATVVAAVGYFLLYSVGFVPQPLQYQPGQTVQAESQTATPADIDQLESAPSRPKHALPQHVSIPAAGIDTSVLNPASRQVSVLNNYLNRGAVRYPRSGYPGNGNLFIFGHSTSHETVWNQAYKTFNNLEDVSDGDTITITTDKGEFRYRIQSKEIKRDSRAYVPLGVNNDMLTISTCDSFGSKEDRIVVRAEFVDYIPTTEIIDK
jgi:LPXTG-site transpeptidase (sortase) family protein